MKKVYFHLRALFYGYPKKSTLLNELNFNPITVVYPKALVMGVLREQRVKVWNVAVTTVEPTMMYGSHKEWMTSIQAERAGCAVLIAEHTWSEIQQGLSSYAKGIKLKSINFSKVNS